MRLLHRLAILTLFALTLAPPILTAELPGPTLFKVDDAFGRDTVVFRSEAPVEDIIGINNEVKGELRVDLQHVGAPSTAARIEIPVGSFKTGIGSRDTTVGRFLGGGRHPVAVFTLQKVLLTSADVLPPHGRVHLKAIGRLDLNGVVRDIPVEADISYIPKGGPFSEMRPGNFLKLSASFDIVLADFGLNRVGEMLPLQVSDHAAVTVFALGSDASGEEAEAYRKRAHGH